MKHKRLMSLLFGGMLLLMLSACGGGEEYQEPSPWTGPGFELLSGIWDNADSGVELQINGDGQAWYIVDGDVLFRGYLEEVILSEGDTGYEYYCRYDLYNDSDTLMFRYYNDPEEGVLLEENTEGTMTDRYEYRGKPETTQNAYAGSWYIQGVSDAYCLQVGTDDTWQLRYPGAEGEILCQGVCREDPFGACVLVIDEESGLKLGSVDREENYLEMGVRMDAPCQLEPFPSYCFYPEEVSRPRISVADYRGWWSCSGLSLSFEILEGYAWIAHDPFGEEDIGGAWEVTEAGLLLRVERSTSLWFQAGEELEFIPRENSSLRNETMSLELIPSFEIPD